MIYNKLTDTYPLVIHAPALKFHEYKAWKTLQSELYYSKKSFTPKNLCIFTWNTKKTSPLKECLDFLGIKFESLFAEQKTWKNLRKITLSLELFQTTNYEYYLGLDSNDILIAGSPEEILTRFQRLDNRLIFGSEKYFWPDCNGITTQWKNAQINNLPYPYLNSGAFIGKRDFLLSWFEECSHRNLDNLIENKNIPHSYTIPGERFSTTLLNTSDQLIHHWNYKESMFKPKLDSKSEIFLTMSNDSDENYVIRSQKRFL